MADCRIVKRTVAFSYNFNTRRVISDKQWVTYCPKCNVMIKSAGWGFHGSTKNTRKSVKDALHRHLLVMH